MAVISPIWVNIFLNIIQNGEAGNGPTDEARKLEYAFIRIDDADLRNLYVWDSNNKKGYFASAPYYKRGS